MAAARRPGRLSIRAQKRQIPSPTTHAGTASFPAWFAGLRGEAGLFALIAAPAAASEDPADYSRPEQGRERLPTRGRKKWSRRKFVFPVSLLRNIAAGSHDSEFADERKMNTQHKTMTERMQKVFRVAVDVGAMEPEAIAAFRIFRRDFLSLKYNANQFRICDPSFDSQRADLEYLRELEAKLLEVQRVVDRCHADLQFADDQIVTWAGKTKKAEARATKAREKAKKAKAELEHTKAINDALRAENARLKSELAAAETPAQQEAQAPAVFLDKKRGMQVVSWDDFVFASVRRLKNRFFGWQTTFCSATGFPPHTLQSWRRRGMVPAETMHLIDKMAPVAPTILRARWKPEELSRLHALADAKVPCADILHVMSRDFPDSPRTLDAVRSAVTRFRRARQPVTPASGRRPDARPVLDVGLA